MYWDRTYEIGIEQIDTEHKEILGLISDIESSYLSQDYASVPILFHTLCSVVESHFHEEELIMSEHSYPDDILLDHVLVHKDLLDSLYTVDFETNLSNENKYKFLYVWAIRHITQYDFKFREYLKSKY